MLEAEALVKRQRLDPERTLEKSNAGLAAAISVLATRIENHGSDMSTAELVQASGLLEKLLAFSEQRRAEVKGAGADADKAKDPPVPLVIVDDRGGKLRGMFLIPPESRKWIDTSDPQYQHPHFSWLDLHFPVNDDGERLDLDALLKEHVRFMDGAGRIHGASL